MTRRCLALVIGVAVGFAFLSAVVPAAAHPYDHYYVVYDADGNRYTARWGQTVIPWQFGNGYAGSGQHWLDRATEALRLWSDASESRILFSKVAADTTNATTRFCQGPDGQGTSETDRTGISVIRRNNDLRHARLGTTSLCFSNDGPTNGEWAVTGFIITIASAPYWLYTDGSTGPMCSSWYATLGTPNPDQCDLASTVIHEAGHAMGHVYHFDQTDSGAPFPDPSVCKPHVGDAGHQTMCKGDNVDPASTYLRTLGDHDIGTLRNAYANWPPPPPPPPPPPTSTTTTVTTPPSSGGGVPHNHCDTLDEPTDPADVVRDAVTEPADANLFGIPTCI